MIRAALVLALFAAPAVAQTALDPQEVLAGLVGKTMTAHDPQTGAVLQTEAFLSGTRSVWRDGEAECVYGEVSTTADFICFVYPELGPEQHCWIPAEMDGRLMMQSANLFLGNLLELREAKTELGCNDIPIG